MLTRRIQRTAGVPEDRIEYEYEPTAETREACLAELRRNESLRKRIGIESEECWR